MTNGLKLFYKLLDEQVSSLRSDKVFEKLRIILLFCYVIDYLSVEYFLFWQFDLSDSNKTSSSFYLLLTL